MSSGLSTVLFCAWLAWSRFRVIIPLADRSWPSVVAALDQSFRIIGGAPTYLLTDNEKTVTDHHIAGIPVRNRGAVDLSRYYGVTIATCVPYDPESKGGSERTVGIAKADLVPTEYNLLADYRDFRELVAACAAAADSFNHRIHAVTRQVPAEALEVERGFLHRVPDAPYSVAFGESRSVGWSSVVSFRGARYSVPDTLVDTMVWVRVHEREVVIVAGEGSGATEVARHDLLGAGGASIVDAHYREHPADPLASPAQGQETFGGGLLGPRRGSQALPRRGGRLRRPQDRDPDGRGGHVGLAARSERGGYRPRPRGHGRAFRCR